MKALTIKQPWAYAITDLDKRIENRTWKPPDWIIGKRIAIHTSKKSDALGYSAIQRVKHVTLPANLPLGSIVATAKIISWVNEQCFEVGIVLHHPSDLVENEWFFGPIGWVLADVQKLVEPIPCRGQLGLWDVPNDLLPKLVTRTRRATH